MGEVFRARDPRLQRDVAIKVLPSSVALDEAQLARFEREARILASLDQNIGGIFGIEEVGGSRALILELARGPVDAVTRLNNGFVRWSPDGKRLAGIGVPGAEHGYIWIVEPLGAIPFRKLADLPADTVPRGASWARDGSSIVIGLSQTSGDVILAERVR